MPWSCGVYSVAEPLAMWLVDADGRAVEPSYPLNDCGLENTVGLFDTLEEADSIENRAALDAAGISLLYGCSSVMTVPAPGPLPLVDLPTYPSGFCRFDTTGPSPVFTGAEIFDGSSPELVEALSNPEPAQPCAENSTSVATTTTTTSEAEPLEVVVELDGCRRILADGFRPLNAPEELLTAIG